MKPIIGITSECKSEPNDPRSHGTISLNWNYAEQVAIAGGVPVILPPTADMTELIRILDGWLIPGGNDIDPTRFDQTLHPKATLQDPARYDAEAALFRALPPDFPILGICYGCQFINVVRGGDLVQHLPDVVGHEDHSGGTLQRYRLTPESKLAEIVGAAEVEGKSYHHQAVGRVAAGLRIVARHEDGVVEAIEDIGPRWMVGVQWHPERTPDDSATQNLFLEFVRAATAYRAGRKRS